MKSILIITVGGSHQPIVRSIEQNKPDFVHFLCSADSGKTKGSYTQIIGEGNVLKSDPKLEEADLPNIVRLTELNVEQYEVHRIKDLDDLNDSYLTALHLVEKIHADHHDARVIVDYTGGTKSMTAGLVAAALDDGRCDIQLVTGLRQDLRQVSDRTEFASPVRVWNVQVQRQMRSARDLIARFDYIGAGLFLQKTALRFASDATRETLQRWLSLCRAFDAWDRFDHATARQLIQPNRGQFVSYAIFLDAVVEGKGRHGFEQVEDLILNTERRAEQQRFDDAVGRLYRVVELMAQTWLRQRHGIDTSNVDMARIPDAVKGIVARGQSKKDVVEIDLLRAWDVVAAFTDDPIGAYFQSEREAVKHFLGVRNQSLFAHGTTPINARDYRQHAQRILTFVRTAMNKGITALGRKRGVILQQLPTEWE